MIISPLGTSASNLTIVPVLYEEYGAFHGLRIGKGSRDTRIKPVSVPLCPPQIPDYLTWVGDPVRSLGNRKPPPLMILMLFIVSRGLAFKDCEDPEISVKW
jgi:hypothetical protein